MNKLFEIQTEDVELCWRAPVKSVSKVSDGCNEVSGHLVVRELRAGVELTHVWRTAVPESIACIPDLTVGPRLHEQTDYRVYARSKAGKRIDLLHADPNIRKGLVTEDDGRLIFGTINFQSEVGFSKFALTVDGKPEFEFELEVFPTKLDYKSDYEQLVAETQDYVSGLVFEYLRSTYKLSVPLLEKQSSTVEWLLLLNLVVKDLERACAFISHRPVRGFTRERQTVNADKVKRLDSMVRKSIHRGSGAGCESDFIIGLPVRERLPSLKAGATLDTPEHRWIAMQLRRIRDRLIALRSNELGKAHKTERRLKIINDLRSLEQRILMLQQIEPFKISSESPPVGFASLQLLSAPGYSECYRACNMLSLGLQIEGGPVNLSLKEISLLYEYWCFLTVVDLLSKATGGQVPVSQLVRATSNGLEIQLKKGKESIVRIEQGDGRRIEVTYNKSISGDQILIPQQPDIMISLEEADWPTLRLLLDAKYRVSFDDRYLARYREPGPDEDAVNVLHRYRDAILESNTESTIGRPKRSIIQAAALFPYQETIPHSYRDSRLWESLDRLGIGAIPLLPGCKQYLEEWITALFSSGGWSIADQAIRHQAAERSDDWRIAASEPVLIGVLNAGAPAEHLSWIVNTKCYYMPLLRSHPRQLFVKHVAIYSPSAIRKPGAVTHRAKVSGIEVKPRSQIVTSWPSGRPGDELQVVYQLESLELMREPVLNLADDGKGRRVSSHRWASRLSLERARTLSELFLESEPEWRLYEQLRASGIMFKLVPAAPNSQTDVDSSWRTWFEFEGGMRVRHAGANGFRLESIGMEPLFFPSVQLVVEYIRSVWSRLG